MDQTTVEDKKTTKTKKTIVDEVTGIVTDHPFAVAGVIFLGGLYCYSKFNQHLTYKAVLNANIDAYELLSK
jgi:hypothetical protein